RWLAGYGDLREERIKSLSSQKAALAKLAFVGLQQRLLSSIAAFARTLKVHRATLQRVLDGEQAARVAAAAPRRAAPAATAMNRVDAWRMIQRRKTNLGMKGRIGCHTFRATGITAYREAGGSLENAQAMAAHESPLYDRTGDEITLDEVERITI